MENQNAPTVPLATSGDKTGADQKDILGRNDRLTVVLKEYDALRKEADQALALMPEIAKSLGVVIAGALIGLKATESLGKGIAMCSLPIIMTVLGTLAHAYHKLETVSRMLMEIEDRVFQMAGEPLLTHETKMNVGRFDRGGKWWYLVAAAATILYFAADAILYCRFQNVFAVDGQSTWVALYWTFVALAGFYAMISGVRIGLSRRKTPKTGLLAIERAKKEKASESVGD